MHQAHIAPNLTFEKELKLNIAGIQLELFHAPGETDDQIFVWLPEFNALMPGDNFYETFPNLYTLRGTSHRDVKVGFEVLIICDPCNQQDYFPVIRCLLRGRKLWKL